MNMKEALIELGEGKAIKRIGGDKVYYIVTSPCFEGYLIDDVAVEEFDSGRFRGCVMGTMEFSEEDIFAEDWIVYTRPRDMTESEEDEIAKRFQKPQCGE